MTFSLCLNTLTASVASRLFSVLPAFVLNELNDLRQLRACCRQMNEARSLLPDQQYKFRTLMFLTGEQMGEAWEYGHFRNPVCRLVFAVLCHHGLLSMTSDWSKGYQAGLLNVMFEKLEDLLID